MDFQLRDRRVVIIGGSKGIGFEVAKGFQEQGAHVTITSELPEVFETQRQMNTGGGPRVEALQFDITDHDAVVEAFSKLGPIDVLVNNAGVFWDTPSEDRSKKNTQVFVKQIMINVVGLWYCALEAVPHMSGGGRIIFTASISGRIGSLNHSGYAATKHAVLGMMKSMAKDLGPRGISVNAICPGSSATEINLKSLPPESQVRAAKNMALHPGLLPPSAHVGSYLFLASAAASEITGQTITVDRGQTISAGAA